MNRNEIQCKILKYLYEKEFTQEEVAYEVESLQESLAINETELNSICKYLYDSGLIGSLYPPNPNLYFRNCYRISAEGEDYLKNKNICKEKILSHEKNRIKLLNYLSEKESEPGYDFNNIDPLKEQLGIDEPHLNWAARYLFKKELIESQYTIRDFDSYGNGLYRILALGLDFMERGYYRRAVICTAIPVEYEAVSSYLENPEHIKHEKGTIYEKGLFHCSNGSWDVLIVLTGMHADNAAVETERAIDYQKPEVAFFVGIAGGIKDVSSGDVVVASVVHGYEGGKAEKTFKSRPEVYKPSYTLLQSASYLALSLDRERNEYRIIIGPIVTGEKVIASWNSEVFKFIKSNFSDAIAVEMESLGFFSAIYRNEMVPGLVIRGISDTISNKNNKMDPENQKIAAKNASEFAFKILSEFE